MTAVELLLLWLVSAASPGPAVGTAGVEIAFDLPGNEGSPAVVAIVARPIAALAVAGDPPAEQRVEIQTTGGRLDLDPRWLWSLESPSGAFWFPPKEIRPAEPGVGARLKLWRTGQLEGTLRPPRNEETPREVSVRFSPLNSSPKELSGTEHCPVDPATRAFRCRLPEGSHWLRFAAPPFQPLYRADWPIAAGRATATGDLALLRGASIIGHVRWPDGKPASGIEVEAALAVDRDPTHGPVVEPVAATTLRVRSDERGFFQIPRVGLGLFRVQARAPGFAVATSAAFETKPDLESELLEALVLARPLTVEIAVDPPTDEHGEPWKLLLHRLDEAGDLGEPLAGRADEQGRFRQGGVAAGRFRVTIEGSGGERVASEVVELTEQRPVAWIDLAFVEVRGTVRFGGAEAANGTLFFGTRHGSRRLAARIDDEGSYAVRLPDGGEWALTWVPAAAAEDSEVELEPVTIPKRRTYRLDIELPDTRVRGEVVDESGQPVEGAIVTILVKAKDHPRRNSLVTDSAGRFSARGLAPGALAVTARKGRAAADGLNSELLEGSSSPPLRLVLHELVQRVGRVVAEGRGIAGVRLTLWPPLGSAGTGLQEVVSGAGGRFEFELSSSALLVNAVLNAPGRGVTCAARPVVPGEEVVFELAPAVGALRVIAEDSASLAQAVLVADGAVIPWPLLTGLLANQIERRGERAPEHILSGLGTGSYRLCNGALRQLATGSGVPPACVDGLLVPGGELVLELPAAAASVPP